MGKPITKTKTGDDRRLKLATCFQAFTRAQYLGLEGSVARH